MVFVVLWCVVVVYVAAVNSGQPELLPWAYAAALLASPLGAWLFRGVLRRDERTGSKAPRGLIGVVAGVGVLLARSVHGIGRLCLLTLVTSLFLGATCFFANEWFVKPRRARAKTRADEWTR